MAKSVKQKAVPKKQSIAKEDVIDNRRKARLIFGTLLLIIGAFITFSIISYFFTWKQDQDKILSAKTAMEFLSAKETIITNWGGRLGALVSHILVFDYVGILALVIGLWIALWGAYLLYDKKVTKLAKYLRWMCFVMLLASPVLTFLVSDTIFPWGGAWGNESIAYLSGLVGRMGTGLILSGIILVAAFIIFSLDIRPLINKARKKALAVSSNLQQGDVMNDQTEENKNSEGKNEPIFSEDSSSDNAHDEISDTTPNATNVIFGSVNDRFANAGAMANSALEVNIKANDHIQSEKIDLEEKNEEIIPVQSIDEKNHQHERLNNDDSERINLSIPEKTKKEEPIDESFSFEVKQVDEPIAQVVPNGGHITIQSDEPYAPELDLPNYKFPTLDLLEDRVQEVISLDKEELEKNKNQIIATLRSFGIEIQRISATVGPTVTLYEIVPAEGVRISKIRNLEDDIALNLAALGIRIIAPIPGRGTIGIEVPNANKQIVSMRALLSSDKFINNKMSLPIALGKKIDNENYIVDLATMPHLLMAGATGQGKSVGINAVLVSLLYKKHPSQLKFVLVDPKKVELSIYNVIEKHFLAKLPNEEEAIITDTKKVINTLNALCIEMDNRYELLKEAGTRNIKEYNEKFISRRLNPEKGHKYLPFIVLVVDEFADLIMTAGKEVEMPIARLAQLARAVGIHLIVATQRPSVNVITGTIKANFPARIAFKVSAKVDSRTILDAGGAEQLVGRGDMLISHGSELLRLQCAFVDTPEVEKIVNFIGDQRGYAGAFELPEYEGADADSSTKTLDVTNRDDLFEDCARLVVQTQSGSTSNLQRRFNLGYNRAGRIMDQLEASGIVGPSSGSKPREVYVKTEMELETYL
jgi:S-DNA-T family DNA segregation ATPase FtsK/SpoIIIE